MYALSYIRIARHLLRLLLKIGVTVIFRLIICLKNLVILHATERITRIKKLLQHILPYITFLSILEANTSNLKLRNYNLFCKRWISWFGGVCVVFDNCLISLRWSFLLDQSFVSLCSTLLYEESVVAFREDLRENLRAGQCKPGSCVWVFFLERQRRSGFKIAGKRYSSNYIHFNGLHKLMQTRL